LLAHLNNLIDDSTMIQLNYEVEIEKKSPDEVARNFLKSKELIE
jgi:glycine betaine/choline ABC-type transport system substrate-binding protein